MHKLINAIGFQAGWWACIAGVGRGLEIEALVFCALGVGAHLHFSQLPHQELKLGVIALLIGIVMDSLLQYFSVIAFYGWALGPLSPFWLWALWVLFGFTLNSSLAFLKTQPTFITAALGLVFGPITYYAGAKLGAAGLDASLFHMLLLALVWMLAMPLLVVAAKQTSHSPKDHK